MTRYVVGLIGVETRDHRTIESLATVFPAIVCPVIDPVFSDPRGSALITVENEQIVAETGVFVPEGGALALDLAFRSENVRMDWAMDGTDHGFVVTDAEVRALTICPESKAWAWRGERPTPLPRRLPGGTVTSTPTERTSPWTTR